MTSIAYEAPNAGAFSRWRFRAKGAKPDATQANVGERVAAG